jgi:hypothetical protein
MTNKPLIEVGLAPEFIQRLKRLIRKFPHAAEDVQGLIARLEHGETPGDQVPGVRYTAYKVRLKSSDVTKGKAAAFGLSIISRHALVLSSSPSTSNQSKSIFGLKIFGISSKILNPRIRFSAE